MTTTAEQMQILILNRVGEPLSGGPIAPMMPVLWSMFTDKGQLPNGARLQFLYCLVEAFNQKIGLIADGAYMPVGLVQTKDISASVPTYIKQRDAALVEIQEIEARAGGLRAPAVGQLTRTAPIQPSDSPYTALGPDPNDRRYRGDPLFGKSGRW
jgi:hypothetical protein